MQAQPGNQVIVGCCGWRKSHAEYYRHFGLIELQQTFYRPPQEKTAERWRREAPAEFIFTLKAWQLITHEPYQPTYLRGKIDIPRAEWEQYGSFRPTRPVLAAWERTLTLAHILESPVIVFQCPPQFGPTPSNIANMRRFFSLIDRTGLVFAWEPRGNWPDEQVAELCAELNLVHCVDPFLRATVTTGMDYFRVHGGPDYTHKFTDNELEQLAGRVRQPYTVFCLFNNTEMWDDGLRFKNLLKNP